MKKLLLSMLCAFMGITASAQSLDYIVLQTADGNKVSLPANGLKITFPNQTLHATSGSRVVDFQLTDMVKMFFSSTPTAIEHVIGTTPKVAIVDGKVQLSGVSNAKVSVYTLDGRQVGKVDLPKGAYLVKVDGKTYKLMAR